MKAFFMRYMMILALLIGVAGTVMGQNYVFMYNGYFTVSLAYIPFLEAFPVDAVNDFLDEYGLGFSISAELAAELPGEKFTSEEGVYWFYPYIQVTVYGGDFVDDYIALFADTFDAAGYEEVEEGYYANAAEDCVQFMYDEDSNSTIIVFMY